MPNRRFIAEPFETSKHIAVGKFERKQLSRPPSSGFATRLVYVRRKGSPKTLCGRRKV
ncbi:MAG: hypothetical protein ACTS4U_01110 [Candidatus Hodgkinia cicadicola]